MMEITDKTLNKGIYFESLAPEDVFKCDGHIFMKIGRADEAYDFTKHIIVTFPENATVVKIKAELILHAVSEEVWEDGRKESRRDN